LACFSASHFSFSPHKSSFTIALDSCSLDKVVVPFLGFHLTSW
jgi:hypothetical protein